MAGSFVAVVVEMVTLALEFATGGVEFVLDRVWRSTGHETRENGPLIADDLLNLDEMLLLEGFPSASGESGLEVVSPTRGDLLLSLS